MPVLHICGAPGAGKSTLGFTIHDIYKSIGPNNKIKKVVVCDLDFVIPSDKMNIIYKTKNSDAKYELWKTQCKLYISRFIEEFDNTTTLVVFVGIMEIYYVDKKGNRTIRNFKMDHYVNYKIFYDPGIKENVRRYYQRAVDNINRLNITESYLLSLGMYIQDSHSFVLDYIAEKGIYKKEHYVFIDSDADILEIVKHYIKTGDFDINVKSLTIEGDGCERKVIVPVCDRADRITITEED